jgi:indole-3-glycerol phosphate synthase
MIVMVNGPILIAEIKTSSPFSLRKLERSWEAQFEIAKEYGDWISIHTDPRWGGSVKLIEKAFAQTDKPILAKGIHEQDKHLIDAFIAGAKYALVVGRIPKVNLRSCIIEAVDLKQLHSLPKNVKAVWNSRDLTDGSNKIETFEQAREAFDGWLCQASNIRTVQDIKAGADAVLVGTHLAEFVASI